MRVSRLVAVIAMLAAVGSASAAGGLPGAHAIKICAAAGPYWPTMTLAFSGDSAWIACKEQSRVIRVNTNTGKTSKSLRLDGHADAVTAGLGSIWAARQRVGSSTASTPASGKIVQAPLSARRRPRTTFGSAAAPSGSPTTRARR